MNKFLIKSILFVIPIVLIVYPLDIYLSKKLADSYIHPGELEVWNDIYNSSIDADIAIYGGSRAWVHFDPALFKDSLNLDTYNFGIDGNNFGPQYIRHKEYFKNNEHPKVIILSVDVYSIAEMNDLYYSVQFLPFMLWNRNLYDYLKPYPQFLKADYFIPMLRYTGRSDVFYIFLNNSNVKYRSNGYRGLELGWTGEWDKIKEIYDHMYFKIDETQILLLEHFIRELKEEGIYLIFVTTPVYIEGQTFVSDREEIFSIFNSISERYEIPFFDYTNDTIFSYNRDLFYNAIHMNKEGAELFTKKFIHDLQKQESTSIIFKNLVGML